MDMDWITILPPCGIVCLLVFFLWRYRRTMWPKKVEPEYSRFYNWENCNIFPASQSDVVFEQTSYINGIMNLKNKYVRNTLNALRQELEKELSGESGDQLFRKSWDKSVRLYNVERGKRANSSTKYFEELKQNWRNIGEDNESAEQLAELQYTAILCYTGNTGFCEDKNCECLDRCMKPRDVFYAKFNQTTRTWLWGEGQLAGPDKYPYKVMLYLMAMIPGTPIDDLTSGHGVVRKVTYTWRRDMPTKSKNLEGNIFAKCFAWCYDYLNFTTLELRQIRSLIDNPETDIELEFIPAEPGLYNFSKQRLYNFLHRVKLVKVIESKECSFKVFRGIRYQYEDSELKVGSKLSFKQVVSVTSDKSHALKFLADTPGTLFEFSNFTTRTRDLYKCSQFPHDLEIIFLPSACNIFEVVSINKNSQMHVVQLKPSVLPSPGYEYYLENGPTVSWLRFGRPRNAI